MGLRRGFSDAGAVIGAFTAAIGLFNATVGFFDLPVAPFLEPLYTLFDKLAASLSAITSDFPPWAHIKSGPKIFIITISMSLLLARAMLYGTMRSYIDENYPKNGLLISYISFGVTSIFFILWISFLYLIFIIPFIWIYFAIVYTIIPFGAIILVFQKDITADMRASGLYIVGAFVGFIALLALNAYY